MKVRINPAIVFVLVQFCFISAVAQTLTTSKGREHNYKTFTFGEQGIKRVVTSEGLRFTVSIRKPETVPPMDEAEKWRVNNRSETESYLFGQSGRLSSTNYSTNIGEVCEEFWISDDAELIAFRQSVTNKTQKQVILNFLYPLYIDGTGTFEFGDFARWLILKQFRQKNDFPAVYSPGDIKTKGVSGEDRVPSAGEVMNCDPFLIINNDRGNGQNLMVGYQTCYLHLADISITIDENLKLNGISANCDFEGVLIPPGGSRTSQWVIISTGTDPDRMISDYAIRMRNFHNVKAPDKNSPSVYCTWYYHATNYNEDIFKGDIIQFRKEHLPFDVFLIDECWDVDDWGDFEANNSFPHGMKWVAQQICSAGYVPGIWSAPFLADEESDLFKNHKEWMLKNSKGRFCTFNMNERDHYILDLTYPGVCDYLEEQFRRISGDWGFRYFKFDFMRAVFLDSDQQFYDKSATSLEAYRRGLEAIHRGTGSDAYISVCGGHYGASLGIADSQRSGSDVKSAWSEKELPKYRQNILRTWMSDLWHVDPDAMMIRRQSKALPDDTRNLTAGLFTDEEAFTNSLNQFIGGNLITFTEDFAVIDADRKMLYRHVIPSANSSSRAIDLFNTNCPEIMIAHISPNCEKLDDWKMLSVINWTDEKKDYQIAIDSRISVNLNGDQYIIYDFRDRKILTYLAKGEVLNINGVAGHQSRLLKIVPWDGESAIFLGTDLNFACGGLEIEEINFKSGRITGILVTSWYLPVTLTFLIPSGGKFEVKELTTVPGQKMFSLDY